MSSLSMLTSKQKDFVRSIGQNLDTVKRKKFFEELLSSTDHHRVIGKWGKIAFPKKVRVYDGEYLCSGMVCGE